jgi:phosphatidylserine decarboxylase
MNMSNEPTPNMGSGSGGNSSAPVDLPAPAIAREGWPIVAAFVIGAAVLTAGASFIPPAPVVGVVVGFVTVALTVWCVWFFRDPKRRIPAPTTGQMSVISPADGVVCMVQPAIPPEELVLGEDDKRGLTRVSVFMNVFNVHVNRSPVPALVEKTAYHPGKFFNASLDKASEHNERMSLLLRMADGRAIVCVQIAGLIARRIVCRVKEGTRLSVGERYGLIRFGSRVDVYLPRGVQPSVKVGDKSVAGETALAVINVAAGTGGAMNGTPPPSSLRSDTSPARAGEEG